MTRNETYDRRCIQTRDLGLDVVSFYFSAFYFSWAGMAGLRRATE